MNKILNNATLPVSDGDIDPFGLFLSVDGFNAAIDNLEKLEEAINSGIAITESLEKVTQLRGTLLKESALTSREEQILSLAGEIALDGHPSDENLTAGNESLVKTLYEIWRAVQALLRKMIEMFVSGIKEIAVTVKLNEKLLDKLEKEFNKQNVTSYTCELTSKDMAYAFVSQNDIVVREAGDLVGVVDGMTDYENGLKQIHVSTSEHRKALIDVLTILGKNINNKLLDAKQIKNDREYGKALEALNQAIIERFNMTSTGNKDGTGMLIMDSGPFLGGGTFVGREYEADSSVLGIESASGVEYRKMISAMNAKVYVGKIENVSAQTMLDLLTAAKSLNLTLDKYNFEKKYFKEIDRIISDFTESTRNSPDRPEAGVVNPSVVSRSVRDFGMAALAAHSNGVKLVRYVIMFCHSGIKAAK